MSKIDQVKSLLTQIKNIQTEKIHMIEKALLEMNTSSQHGIAYMTESISLSANPEDEHIIIGTFQLMNIGTKPIHQPIILLKVKSEPEIRLSGKFTMEGKASLSIHQWERIKAKDESPNEYWLKPLKISEIPPGERLVFNDFQLRFPMQEKLSLTVEGFAYYKENPEGIRAFNSINIMI
ncbi:hypothetical protein [Bacillus sp. FJAT-50079]|uniref:hypothetical protein n=1 Tax=Bacillus sp. FJAT-50079 TaxID=2833577 RepID=UPI001BCA637F|nr:hypothetical protein [Bacillus sp. FJAT-50079]MBS4206950.1 hypothetical protein [Bacillus sp. FJAT-50079]